MSQYTSVMLFISVLEDETERIQEVQEFTLRGKKIGFLDLNDTKHFPDAFPRYSYAATFNYLPLNDFLNHLQHKVRWEYPDHVQILIQEETPMDCSFYVKAGAQLVYKAVDC
jgi:hypothetical protein